MNSRWQQLIIIFRFLALVLPWTQPLFVWFGPFLVPQFFDGRESTSQNTSSVLRLNASLFQKSRSEYCLLLCLSQMNFYASLKLEWRHFEREMGTYCVLKSINRWTYSFRWIIYKTKLIYKKELSNFKS